MSLPQKVELQPDQFVEIKFNDLEKKSDQPSGDKNAPQPPVTRFQNITFESSNTDVALVEISPDRKSAKIRAAGGYGTSTVKVRMEIVTDKGIKPWLHEFDCSVAPGKDHDPGLDISSPQHYETPEERRAREVANQQQSNSASQDLPTLDASKQAQQKAAPANKPSSASTQPKASPTQAKAPDSTSTPSTQAKAPDSTPSPKG
jgi:hypothetical protein